MNDEIKRRPDASGGPRAIPYLPDYFVEGYLDGPISASGSLGSSPTTATLSVWRVVGGTWQDTGENVTLTNRDPTLEADASAFVQAFESRGEWRPFWVGCS